MNDTHTTNAVISCFAMALRGQSLDEYNAEDTHTRRTAEKQIETALQVTGFVLGAPLVPNSDSCSGVVGPWPTLSAVHPSVAIVSDREGDRWRRDRSTSRFGDDWLLFDKKIGAWRPWEISLHRASHFAPFSELEKTTKAEYPHPGLAGLTVLGPEIFTDGEVINWRGENFVREQGPEPSSSVTPVATDTGPWPSLLAVPQTVNKVLDKDGDAWTRTPRGWKCGNQVCTSGSGGGGCLAGHPKYGPFVAVKAEQ